MTTVVAYGDGRTVWMAGDTCTNVYERPIPGGAVKIHRVKAGDGEVLIGVCGHGGLAGHIPAHLKLSGHPAEGEDPQSWAHTVAVAITDIAVEAGLVENGQLDGHLMLGWGGQVWTVVHGMAIPHLDGRAAIGSGEGPAIGALDALLNAGFEPQDAIVRAVWIGINRDRYSEGPVQTETLPGAEAK